MALRWHDGSASAELHGTASPPPTQLTRRLSASDSGGGGEEEAGDPDRIPAAVFEQDPSASNKDWSMMLPTAESVFGLQVAPSSDDFTGFSLAHPAELMEYVATPPRGCSAVVVDADADGKPVPLVSPPFESTPVLPESAMTGNYSFASPRADWSPPAGHQSSLQATTPPPPTALMEDDEAAMDLVLLLTGPKDELNLDECLGGVFDCYSPQLEVEDLFDSLSVSDGEPAANEIDIEDYIDPSMLGCFQPCSSLGHGRRGLRRKSSSERLGLFGHNFGPHEPSTSGGRKHIGRKNNKHWTTDEVRLLVMGVCLYGVGRWSDIKRKYFEASIRTSDHLKDKWKNLLKACNKENGRMLLPLEASLIELIKEIDAKHPYRTRSN